MLVLTAWRHGRPQPRQGAVTAGLAALLIPVLAFQAGVQPASAAASQGGSRTVAFHGLQVVVPAYWEVVELARQTDACVRYDRPALYLGHTGDQSACPSHLIGGAPALQIEVLDAQALERAPQVLIVDSTAQLRTLALAPSGPVSVAVEPAGVLVTAVYGPDRAAAMRTIVSTATVLPGAHATDASSLGAGQTLAQGLLSVPGTFHGSGFDACTAPSQGAMDAWKSLTDYRSIGVYIGGISRGCSQPNLTAAWTARQVAQGWHVVPTYAGRQAPCTGFHYRMSYDPQVAFSQGSAEALDAVDEAQALGMAAPSTIYSDVEGYNSSLPQCVASVLSYISGWVHALHTLGYLAGVYSSASSGMHDLSTHYDSDVYHRPDHIWMAWWNGRADVEGGGYVPDSQWSAHRRDHQYEGNVAESHGGYGMNIDRNFLDVSWLVPPPPGCPANLDFRAYPMLVPGNSGPWVRAAQCLLARAGFDVGAANGFFGWRMGAGVKAFKATRGLDASDACIRRWAWTALASAGPQQFLQYGATGLRVSKVQRTLTARLQFAVPITSFFGPVTQRAVKRYQTLQHMTATGTVGVPTWAALKAGR